MPISTTLITVTNAILTAYCACGRHPQCPSGTLTAIGRPPVHGRTVAVSRAIPLESTVSIRLSISAKLPAFCKLPNQQTRNRDSFIQHDFVAEDRFNKRFELTDNTKRVDIFFGTNHNAAVNFGRRTGTVTYTIYGRP